VSHADAAGGGSPSPDSGSSRPRPLEGRSIAVFGSSEPQAGTPEYEDARRLGQLLAEAGARVVNGGYGGVMEATSRGARERGGRALGVTGSFFEGRSPNAYLSDVRPSADLFERTRLLIEFSDAFIILPGKSGTIAELAALWALDRAGLLGERPVILCGPAWPGLIEAIARAGALEPAQRRISRLCRTVEESVESLVRTGQNRGRGQEWDRT